MIRANDSHSVSSILKKCNFPDDEFDLDRKATLTYKHTKETKANSEKYRYLSNNSTFYFMEDGNCFYDVDYRVVRFKIDELQEYESIVTNLPRELYSPEELKE